MSVSNWNFTTNDVLTASTMNEITANPQMADVATDETRVTASYGDLSTVGPSLTKTLVSGQRVLVYVAFDGLVAADGAEGRMSFAVSGATTQAASDANSARYFSVKTGTNTAGQVSKESVFTASASGSHTFTAKYKGDGTNTMHFLQRRIIIKPF